MARAEITFAIATTFSLGILLATSTKNLYPALMLLVLGALLFSLVSTIPAGRMAWYIFGLLLGIGYWHAFIAVRQSHISLPIGTATTLHVTVLAPPILRSGTTLFSAAALLPYRGTFTVATNIPYSIRYGDTVELRGTIEPGTNPYRDPLLYATQITLLQGNVGWTWKRLLFAVKRSFIEHLVATLPEDEGALAAGLTLGDQNGFRDSLKSAMKKSGTTHLVALSGYNIAIIITALEELLRNYFRKRMVFAATLGTVLLFVIMVGGQASIVRAAIMGLLIAFARNHGRVPIARIVIAVSAMAMLIQDPRLLRWDLGFQLSFLSFLGIAYVLPAAKNLLKIDTDPGILGWKESILASASAQCAVFPLIVQVFGSASLVGIFTNVLMVSVVPITMALGVITGIAAMVSAALGGMFAWLLHPLLWYQVNIIYLGSHFSLSVGGSANDTTFIIVYYATVVWLVIHYYPKPKFPYRHFDEKA